MVGDHDLVHVAGLDLHRGQVQAVGDRVTAGRDQDPVGPKLRLAAGHRRGGDHMAGRLVESDLGDLGPANHPDALVGEDLLQSLGDLRLLPGCQPGADQHGHVRAQPGEQLGLLQGHVAAAEDQQRLRDLGQLHRRGGGQVVHRVQAVDRRDPGPGAGGDQVVVGFDELAAYRPRS